MEWANTHPIEGTEIFWGCVNGVEGSISGRKKQIKERHEISQGVGVGKENSFHTLGSRGFNKHRRPTKSVGYFDQGRRLLSA